MKGIRVNRDHCSHFSLIFKIEKKIIIFFCENGIGKKGGWRSHRTMTGNTLDMKIILKGLGCKWKFLQPLLIKLPSNNQISICLCQIEIAKCWGWRIYQVTMGKWRQLKIIFISHQSYMDGNRNYCSHFSLTFETTGKLLIDFVKLILGKMGFDGVTGIRQETDIWYEFDLG